MSEFKAGDKVMHSLFGLGDVASVAGSGADARVTVDFAPSVGRKKLLASVANLQKAGDAASRISSSASAWFEELHANAKPRGGRRIDGEKIRGEIRAEVVRQDFWIAVRERLRSRGHAPKAIDDPNENVYLSPAGLLNVGIAVKHGAMADARDSAAARAIFDELAARILRDFEAFSFTAKTSIHCHLGDEDRVFIEETQPGELPAREPKQRPKRVQPKGTIRSMPKRRDDY